MIYSDYYQENMSNYCKNSSCNYYISDPYNTNYCPQCGVPTKPEQFQIEAARKLEELDTVPMDMDTLKTKMDLLDGTTVKKEMEDKLKEVTDAINLKYVKFEEGVSELVDEILKITKTRVERLREEFIKHKEYLQEKVS